MTEIEQAKLNFEANFLTVKGVVGVCIKSDWIYSMNCDVYKSPETFSLVVYVDNVRLVDKLPEFFQGFAPNYVVVPSGISPGCD